MSELPASSSSEALAVLTPIEEQFALAYFRNGGNAGKAYREVRPDVAASTGYTEGWKLLRKPEIQAAIEALRQELRERVQVDTEVIAQRLKAVALGELREIVSWHEPVIGADGQPMMIGNQVVRGGLDLKPSSELTPEQAALIEEISFTPNAYGTSRKVKLQNRVAAAKLLLELRGELVKNVKVEGEVTHRVMALPAEQPSTEEWTARYAPGRQVKATDVKVEEVGGGQA